MDLKDKEKNTFDTIKKIMDGNMTRKEAEFELHKSRQQIYRLINIYKKKKKKGFIHKNRGKNNPNKIDEKNIEELEQLYLTKYYDFNFEHFFEKIKDRYDISYPSLYRAFINDDIISPLAHKETIKLWS